MKTAIIAALVAVTACADPGPPIPLPAQDLTQAVAIARAKLLELADTPSETNQVQQCIVLRVSYETPYTFTEINKEMLKVMLGKKQPFLPTDRDNTWFFTFVHPVENDAPFVVRILRDGKAVLIVPEDRKK
jgi:hypothetical protein